MGFQSYIARLYKIDDLMLYPRRPFPKHIDLAVTNWAIDKFPQNMIARTKLHVADEFREYYTLNVLVPGRLK